MAELEFITSLFTPASDLVVGETGFDYEAVFGRRGNDSLYADSPVANRNQRQNIDILFGDLFDNTPEEYEIILNIQNIQQGGNPLLILERNIPSVGRDRHVLGDTRSSYYLNPGSPLALLTTNLFGTNEFAIIYDFAPAHDTIQLNGKPEDYILLDLNGIRVEGIQQAFFGKGIFSLKQGIPDLVGYIIARPEVQLSLTGDYFEFVGNKPAKKPQQRRVEQLTSPGLELGIGSATDPSGNVYITGWTTGTLQGTSKGLADYWVAKYDRRGNQQFIKQFGTSSSELALDVETDSSGNFYLAGGTQGSLFGPKQSEGQDGWIAKYDPNGNLLWGRQFGDNLTEGFSIGSLALDVDSAGNVYASVLSIKENNRRDIFDFPAQDDSWAIKFDKDGNQQWFTQIKDPNASFPFNITPFFDEAYDISVDKDGNTYLTGWTQGLVKEADPISPTVKYDIWLAKVNPGGQVDWVQQLGSPNQGLDFAWGVDTDSKGNIYTYGWTTGDLVQGSQANTSYDIWLAKFRPDSTLEWVRQFGTPKDDGALLGDLKIDAKDNIYMTGYTNGRLGRRNRGGYDAWTAKFDSAGNSKWVQQFGSAGLDYATGLSINNKTGKVYVTGFTDGPLGNVNTEAVDAWVAELDGRRGRIDRFTGSAKGAIAGSDPITAPLKTPQIVPDERLPGGDNRIDPDRGISDDLGSFNPQRFNSQLARLFDTKNPNAFPGALANSLTDDFSDYFDENNLNVSNTVFG
jgi:Beta-propeller repeat